LVQLGPVPEAMGIYPGGQSGNPASPFYDNFTEAWRKGQYRKLKFRN
jgi:penicillin amidase